MKDMHMCKFIPTLLVVVVRWSFSRIGSVTLEPGRTEDSVCSGRAKLCRANVVDFRPQETPGGKAVLQRQAQRRALFGMALEALEALKAQRSWEHSSRPAGATLVAEQLPEQINVIPRPWVCSNEALT